MGRCKETLGYPSRTAAIAALRAQGDSCRQVADKLGVSLGTVAALANSYKRKIASQNRTVLFPARVIERLHDPARSRGLLPHELIRQIVETVAEDSLVDAILDDKAW
ncbi:MAG: helix-turn-helix domain-containing protein [Afipia sp.]|nr:helix-turn-helix domain-containing protein [Afipia sp.]OJW65497.1 MAG: hypothetical protein BGO65_12280 [Afipia sp. 64-13]